MDLTRYVDDLRQQLLVAADAGGEEARIVAERLVAPLQASTRLVLLDALAAAASEITSELAPGSVDVRLRGREPEFVVTLPPTDAETDLEPSPSPAVAPAPPTADADDGATARMTLRLPDPLKQRIEDAASRDGLSVNSWLVRTLSVALDPPTEPRRTRRSATGSDRFTGWTS